MRLPRGGEQKFRLEPQNVNLEREVPFPMRGPRLAEQSPKWQHKWMQHRGGKYLTWQRCQGTRVGRLGGMYAVQQCPSWTLWAVQVTPRVCVGPCR